MIAFLQGVLQDIETDAITVNVGGVGYRVMLPEKTINSLPVQGTAIIIHTYFNVREDSASLYGFMSKDELELYKKLLTVSGVGPKVALNILGSTEGNRFVQAILNEELAYLTKLPGVGKKTGQRLILELKDKLVMPTGVTVGDYKAGAKRHPAGEDALEALLGLGYQPPEILPLLTKGQEILGPEATPQTLIRFVLQGIAKDRGGS